MKISCDVIKDILPLYVEDMVSEDTKNLVREHISGCPECTDEMSRLCASAKVPEDADARSLKLVEKKMRRQKRWTAVTAIILVITILTGLGMFLFVPVWLTAEEAVEYVVQVEDGNLKFKFTDLATGWMNGSYTTHGGKSGGKTSYVWYLCDMTRYRVLTDLLFPELKEGTNQATMEGYMYLFAYDRDGNVKENAGKFNLYYLDITDGTVETVLWDAGEDVPEHQIFSTYAWAEHAWCLRSLFFVVLAVWVVLTVAAVLLRKHGGARWMKTAAVIFGSCTAALLLVTNGRFLAVDADDLNMKLCCIWCMTVLFVLSVQCIRKLHAVKLG